MKMTIDVGKQFTRYPGGRYSRLGSHSGEEFRDEILLPALLKLGEDDQLVIKLDSALGYSSSFLEETFGGLIRKGFDIGKIKKYLILETSKSLLEKEIWEYISSATKDSSAPVT